MALEAFETRPLVGARPIGARPFATESFEAQLQGELLVPGTEAYEAARRIRNAAYDLHPAMIVRVAGAEDVSLAVRFATAAGLQIAVRSGGHSLAGYGSVDGGLVIDMTALKGLHIDPDRRIAWAGAGLTAREYTTAAAAHGLATPFGDTGSVGIAGLTLGGGIGWLVRKYGLAIDALRAVEIVTADGRIVTASDDIHPDLFWAVRGGGGNFGIVTRFRFELYPVPGIFGGALFMPATTEVLRNLEPLAAAAPEELTTITFAMRMPPAPFVPAHLVGQPSVAIMFAYAGDPADGPAAIEPFREVATPLAELAVPMPYPGIYALLEAAEQRGFEASRSRFLDRLDDEAVGSILGAIEVAPSPKAMVQIRILGGAMARVPSDATAFTHRDAKVMVAVLDPYDDPATRDLQVAWVESLHEALAPNAVGVYSNFLEREGDDRIREAYGARTYQRLALIKRRYDPRNLFRLNQNIRPAGLD
jgi:FAD/FMN-containing dehydrogenase